MKQLVLCLFGLGLVVGYSAKAQEQSSQRPELKLRHLAQEQDTWYQQRHLAALRYAADKQLPISYRTPEGTLVELAYLSEEGALVYKALHDNASSVITMAANDLYPGGIKGLNLTGEGVTVHIWDGGKVLDTHADFEGRVVNETNTGVNFHATHVMGTILGGGVEDATARGIAYDANGIARHFNENDLGKMASLAADGEIMISNHSYGLVTGWSRDDEGNWVWAGLNPNVEDDFRFGFYSETESVVIDRIAYNSPYYTIVWSAGNDRDDIGDGSRKADGPFDCIGPEGTSKNNITVGAVNAVLEYKGPDRVAMSDFSSWGPVDDGRVKPDICAMGVNVRSVGSNGDRAYTTLSGTSMAAPGVTGGIILLQQLYGELHNEEMMTSAMVKALLAHSAKEAGNIGPDYSFGWGLADVSAAADILLNENELDTLMIRDTLFSGETHDYPIFTDGSAPFRATIAWTDPPGTPLATGTIDDRTLMLVNDLDIRLVNTVTGEEVNPYILDPEKPAKLATTGDNFRDNIEQILLTSPDPRSYVLRVSHKGENLENGEQVYNLVVSTVAREQPSETLYLVGADIESEASWSLSTGGEVANVLPSASSTIIIDENSPTLSDVNGLSGNLEVKDFFIYGNNAHVIDLNSFEISISGDLFVTNANAEVTNGNIKLISKDGVISTTEGALRKAKITLTNPAGGYRLVAGSELGEVTLEGGALTIKDGNVAIGTLTVTGTDVTKSVILEHADISIGKALSLGSGLSIRSTDSELSFKDGEVVVKANAVQFSGLALSVEGATVALEGSNVSLDDLVVSAGSIQLPNGTSILNLNGKGGGKLLLEEGAAVDLMGDFVVSGTSGNLFTIQSTGSMKSSLNVSPFRKVCLDFVSVSNVDQVGDAIVSLGESGSVTTGNNWQLLACEDVLFPSFSVRFACEGGFTVFENESSGKPTSFSWDFGDGTTVQTTSDSPSPSHSYSQSGTFAVKLTVSLGDESVTGTQPVTIDENGLEVPTIITAGETGLAVAVQADSYQWFVNGDSITDATRRSYDHQGMPGEYQVVISNDTCTKISTAYKVEEVTGIELPEVDFSIYPNPTSEIFTIEVGEFMTKGELQLFNLQGQLMLKRTFNGEKASLRVDQVPPGVYILHLIGNNKEGRRQVVVE